MNIYASSEWGSNLERWGAWGFTDKKTRDRLARTIKPDDYVLSIGTRGKETSETERGRLLLLMRIGTELIATRDLVDPEYWNKIVAQKGVGEPWPFGFPIKSAERFDNPPLRSMILPRLDKENLHITLARHFIQLTREEVGAVLSLPRTPDTNIYSTPTTAFASRMRGQGKGPPPFIGSRTLTTMSGTAATYCMELTGAAASHLIEPLKKESGQSVFKVGFSNDPDRRRGELNAFLPCESTAHWFKVRVQWHDDEINAWALEQEIFNILGNSGINRFKGEMIIATRSEIEAAWEAARKSAQRPEHEVIIPI